MGIYALFGSLASLKIIPLVAPGILSRFFFSQFISRIEIKFKRPRSDRGFLFEGFFYKSLHFHLFLSSHSDSLFQQLIYFFDFGYFFYSTDFFAFCKVFSTFHIARGIIKLTA